MSKNLHSAVAIIKRNHFSNGHEPDKKSFLIPSISKKRNRRKGEAHKCCFMAPCQREFRSIESRKKEKKTDQTVPSLPFSRFLASLGLCSSSLKIQNQVNTKANKLGSLTGRSQYCKDSTELSLQAHH
jgi:hypothetical protein